MDKSNPPETFGVFKPVGHTVIVFRSESDLEAAVTAFNDQGFDNSKMVRYTPQEMIAQCETELQNASPLAAFGYELSLVKAYLAQAQEGCSFLVVHAPDENTAQQVASIAQKTKAVAAEQYGNFMIEEVLTPPPGQTAP